MSLEEVSLWCQENYISSFIETSAKTSKNVKEAFILAVRQWQKLEKTTERELRAAHGDTIDLTKSVQLQTTNKSCCNLSSFSTSSSPSSSLSSQNNSPFRNRNENFK